MHPYPHTYSVQASAHPDGDVALASEGLATLTSAPPPEFDGPGGRWSPETLLCAAVADCIVLSFRAVAKASRLEWTSVDCGVTGTVDRADGRARFTRLALDARLVVPPGVDVERARRLIEKAEQICLISNSLLAERHLAATVRTG